MIHKWSSRLADWLSATHGLSIWSVDWIAELDGRVTLDDLGLDAAFL